MIFLRITQVYQYIKLTEIAITITILIAAKQTVMCAFSIKYSYNSNILLKVHKFHLFYLLNFSGNQKKMDFNRAEPTCYGTKFPDASSG